MWEGLVSGGFGSFRFLVTTCESQGEKMAFKNKIILIKLLAAVKQEHFPPKNMKTLWKIDGDILENPIRLSVKCLKSYHAEKKEGNLFVKG